MMNTTPEVLTFGCRLNIAESEAMQRHAVAADLGDAVIINTCAVTAEAERQAGQANDEGRTLSDPAEHRRRIETRVSDVPGLVLPDWNAVMAYDYHPGTATT